MPKKIFEGVKVADFAWQVEGPQISSALAGFGAEVVKVEGSMLTSIDIGRVMPPFKDGISRPDNSFEFSAFNPGKMSLVLDLNHPRGQEVAKRLVAWADIVNENFAGGKMAKWGLDYQDLVKIKPDIIMISSPVFGQTGPYAKHPGYGTTLTAMSCLRYLTGWPDMPAQEPGHVYTDFIGWRIGILLLAAALDYRRRTGKGQYIDMSQFEVTEHFLMPLLLDAAANERDVGRIGNRSTYAAPHGVYRCKGEHRYCSITVFTDEEWKSFCEVIGKPKWTEDTQFAALLDRLKNVDELDRLVEEWTINHSPEEVMALMQGAGVPAAVVQNAEDLDKDPQLRSRHFYCEVEHPVLGNITYLGYPKLSKTPYEIRRSPCLGEHNFYVCTELLGMPDEEFIELDNAGVFK